VLRNQIIVDTLDAILNSLSIHDSIQKLCAYYFYYLSS